MTNNKGCTGCKQASTTTNDKVDILKNFFPFLKNEFRELKKNEIESEKVFKELFPDEKTDLGFLKAVFEFQKLQRTNSK